jgi:hypothetical protein
MILANFGEVKVFYRVVRKLILSRINCENCRRLAVSEKVDRGNRTGLPLLDHCRALSLADLLEVGQRTFAVVEVFFCE